MAEISFRENVVILTGASSGIGRQLALQLAEQGAWLALAARNVENLSEVAGLCVRRGGKAIVVPTDVGEMAQCKNLVARTLDEFGRIDTLINNAGIGVASRFDEMPDLTVFEQVIQVNFFGSVYCTFFALPHLKQTRGRLVGVSSLRGKFASATADGYGASKHAMAGFFDSLRLELAESGVTVTMIYPGWVSTGISSRALKPDGTPINALSAHEVDAMPVETCARIIVRTMAGRRREVVMTGRARLALFLRAIMPGIVDRAVRKSTE